MFKMVNLGIHFLLEIAALVAVGYWGFKTGSAAESKAFLGVGLPLLLAAVWGVFRVPNDPGPAVVAVPGWLRMIIEFGVFAFAVWCLAAAGRLIAAGIPVWVFIAPLLPGLTDTGESLAALFRAIRAAGVRDILLDHLNPYPAAVSRLKSAYRRHFPQALPGLEEYLRHPGRYRDETDGRLKAYF
jgi:hypothetical protein